MYEKNYKKKKKKIRTMEAVFSSSLASLKIK